VTFNAFWDKFYFNQYHDSFGSFLTLHEKFLTKHLDIKTITKRFGPTFKKDWEDKKRRHLVVDGGEALRALRSFYSKTFKKNLSQNYLNKHIIKLELGEIEKLIEMILS